MMVDHLSARQRAASSSAKCLGELHQFNSLLGKNFITKYDAKQGIIVLGRVVPFGISVAIGGDANALATWRAFSPAPLSWADTYPEPRRE
ncbi:hypothetical protein ACRAKI_22480 [Saccharothrix isguenensis]